MKFDIIEVRKLINGVKDKQASDKMQEIVSDCICKNGHAVDIKKLAYQMGFITIEGELKDTDDVAVKYSVNEEDERYIIVDKEYDVAWQRFFIAQGISNFILNYKGKDFEYTGTCYENKTFDGKFQSKVAMVLMTPKERFINDVNEAIKLKNRDEQRVIRKLFIDYGIPEEYIRLRISALKIKINEADS